MGTAGRPHANLAAPSSENNPATVPDETCTGEGISGRAAPVRAAGQGRWPCSREADFATRPETVSYVGGVVGLGMGRGTWSWIVPDGLWEIAEPLVPPSRVRPQGGGTQDTTDETLFAAIIYVLVSGCAWRALPPCFGVSKSTTHRRFLIWSRAGVWGRLHEEILHRLDDAGLLDLSRAVLDSAHVRAKGGRTHGSEPRGPGQTRFENARPAGREPPLQTPSSQPPGFPRPRCRPQLLEEARSSHHSGTRSC